MADEQFTSTRVDLTAASCLFVAHGKRVNFAGYRAAYTIQGDDEGRLLPTMQQGDQPECTGVDANGRETRPPARFTEASLVQTLEEEGIGRPSTYASILDTIQRRGYVVLKGKALVPSFRAFAVVGLLEKHFPDLVDMSFTANMEKTLDAIASGEAEWVPFLDEFFLGKKGLKAQVDGKMETMDAGDAKIIDLGDFPFVVKTGRFGTYVESEVDGEPTNASIPESMTPDELDAQEVRRLVQRKAAGPQSIGRDVATGLDIFVLDGRFGPYYQLGDEEKPKRASLPKGKHIDDATVEEGTFLLSLPLTLGMHPEGGEVAVGQGRFGPYVMYTAPDAPKPEYRSIKAPDTMSSMKFDRAMELLSVAKAGRRGPSVIKELGEHPKKGGAVKILDGRYGPYVNFGKINATVPKDQDPNALTMDAALELLAAKQAK
jgi:DNA topoisomerase-1